IVDGQTERPRRVPESRVGFACPGLVESREYGVPVEKLGVVIRDEKANRLAKGRPDLVLPRLHQIDPESRLAPGVRHKVQTRQAGVYVAATAPIAPRRAAALPSKRHTVAGGRVGVGRE